MRPQNGLRIGQSGRRGRHLDPQPPGCFPSLNSRPARPAGVPMGVLACGSGLRGQGGATQPPAGLDAKPP